MYTCSTTSKNTRPTDQLQKSLVLQEIRDTNKDITDEGLTTAGNDGRHKNISSIKSEKRKKARKTHPPNPLRSVFSTFNMTILRYFHQRQGALYNSSALRGPRVETPWSLLRHVERFSLQYTPTPRKYVGRNAPHPSSPRKANKVKGERKFFTSRKRCRREKKREPHSLQAHLLKTATRIFISLVKSQSFDKKSRDRAALVAVTLSKKSL